MTVQTSTTNLFSLDRQGLEDFFVHMGEKSFRGRQLMQWMYQRMVVSPQEMTNLSKLLRNRLTEGVSFDVPEISHQKLSSDGTCKWLLRLHDGNCIETVFIPEDDRGTLCVSSQVGCSLNCDFCATARQGFSRNLTVDEIIGQVWIANERLESMGYRHDGQAQSPDTDCRRPVTNVVMMGMGEPLANFENVVAAMNLMMDDYSFGLSRRRVTLSTAGMVPQMDRLRQVCPVSLAVSLHATEDSLRDRLVPLNRKYPLRKLLDACIRYVDGQGRQRITFEYVLLDGINDSPEQARQLSGMLKDIPAKVNLIPFNPFPRAPYRRSHPDTIERFREILLAAGTFTVTRRTRGDDISAACGQLVGDFADRTSRSRRMQDSLIEIGLSVRSEGKDDGRGE